VKAETTYLLVRVGIIGLLVVTAAGIAGWVARAGEMPKAVLPCGLLVVAFAAPLLVAARNDRRIRRSDAGACPECGYSRGGIADGSPCPECGLVP
jgi:hypothetical protein